ncbi:MAG: tRNA (cytidine(34)-2'-O)-methyltransferase [Alphaproteobacteria bacterium]|nr:tRNA (cytidine(34)-2'-O)-methyltransferase [Alphaproteobacteria bacterium]
MPIALYQPEIPQNVGTTLRTCACFQTKAHIINPCGFVLKSPRMQRALMDYEEHVSYQEHQNWDSFLENTHGQRIVLLDVKGHTPFHQFDFQPTDIILAGKESTGVPDSIFQSLPHSVHIPMAKNTRSLNVAVAVGIVLSAQLCYSNEFDFDNAAF